MMQVPEKGESHLHRCASTLSSNFGADKSVTVPARASRIRAKVDMIDGMMCREFVSVNGSWLDQCCTTGVKYGGKEEGCGDRYIQMTDSRWAFIRFSPRPKTTWIGYVCGRFAQNTP